MAVITISRGTCSGGRALAEHVAEKLGLECVSREVLLDGAATFGISAEKLAAAVEHAPSFLERLGRHRDVYLAVFRAAVCERARHGNLVYHGHAGHFLLAGVSHVLRVRVVAPIEQRIEAGMKQLSVSRAEAESYIHKVDRERERWTHFLYHVAWQDPVHYDLVLNLERTSIRTACDMVVAMATSDDFRPTPESQRSLLNLALRSRVTAALAVDPRTEDCDLRVIATEGEVTIRGWVRNQEAIDAVPDIAGKVEGVEKIHSEIAIRTGLLF